MKTFILILLLAIMGSSFNYAHSQEAQLTRKQRNNIDKIAREVILKYGDIHYHEMLDNNRRTISLRTVTDKEHPYYGKLYYEVYYDYDPEWRYRMTWDYVAKVCILKDSMTPYELLFGNGYTYYIEQLKKQEAQGEEIPKLLFYLYDKEKDLRPLKAEEMDHQLRKKAHIRVKKEQKANNN